MAMFNSYLSLPEGILQICWLDLEGSGFPTNIQINPYADLCIVGHLRASFHVNMEKYHEISPSFLQVFLCLTIFPIHATSHSFGSPGILGTTQRLRRPPVMETLDGNMVKTMSPWAVLKKNARLGRCSSIDWPKESEAGKPSKYWGLPRCRQRCQNERT